MALANIGRVYLHPRDHFTAISYYQRVLALSHELKDPVLIKKWTLTSIWPMHGLDWPWDQTNPRIAPLSPCRQHHQRPSGVRRSLCRLNPAA